MACPLRGVRPQVSAAKQKMFSVLWPNGRHYKPDEADRAVAIASLAAECGLSHVLAAEWPEHVRAVQPETGEKIDEGEAILAEIAPGVSVEMLTLKVPFAEAAAAIRGARSDLVRDAALYDVLFLQARGVSGGERCFWDAADWGGLGGRGAGGRGRGRGRALPPAGRPPQRERLHHRGGRAEAHRHARQPPLRVGAAPVATVTHTPPCRHATCHAHARTHAREPHVAHTALLSPAPPPGPQFDVHPPDGDFLPPPRRQRAHGEPEQARADAPPPAARDGLQARAGGGFIFVLFPLSRAVAAAVSFRAGALSSHKCFFLGGAETPPPRPPPAAACAPTRCHVPGGAIGRDYPPKFRACLDKFSRSSEQLARSAAVRRLHLRRRCFRPAAASGGAARRQRAHCIPTHSLPTHVPTHSPTYPPDAPTRTRPQLSKEYELSLEKLKPPKGNGPSLSMAERLRRAAAALLEEGFEGAIGGERVPLNNDTGLLRAARGFDPGAPCCAVGRCGPGGPARRAGARLLAGRGLFWGLGGGEEGGEAPWERGAGGDRAAWWARGGDDERGMGGRRGLLAAGHGAGGGVSGGGPSSSPPWPPWPDRDEACAALPAVDSFFCEAGVPEDLL